MTANAPVCPVCQKPLAVRLALGRKSRKPFVMMVCAEDGRHFRGFISHRPYVQAVLDKVESMNRLSPGGKP